MQNYYYDMEIPELKSCLRYLSRKEELGRSREDDVNEAVKILEVINAKSQNNTQKTRKFGNRK